MNNAPKPTAYVELDQTLFMHDPKINPVKPKPRRPIDNMIVAPTSS